MRLWHYKLIPVLPDKMLISQWRECIAIKRQWEKSTLKHRLVRYVEDYNNEIFGYYVICVVNEMSKRHIKFQTKYLIEILTFTRNYKTEHYKEHNNRYLKQCYYNLQEKYDRGIISEDEWEKIKKVGNE